jgi:flagellar hook-length control protein FliK
VANAGAAAGAGNPTGNLAGTLAAITDALAAVAGSADARTGADAGGRDSGSGHRPGADGTPITTSLDLASAMRTAGGAAPATVERTIAVPVHDRHWSQALAAQLLVLNDQKVESATLRLSPEHLGPVEVHIDIQDSKVNLSFGAAHSDTRTALEQAMPRLREAFAGAGLTLGEATVGQQMRRDSQNSQPTARQGAGSDEPVPIAMSVSRTIGLVDEYV